LLLLLLLLLLLQAIAPASHTATASTSTLCKLLAWHQAGTWKAAAAAGASPRLMHQADWLAYLLHGEQRAKTQQFHQNNSNGSALGRPAGHRVMRLLFNVCFLHALFGQCMAVRLGVTTRACGALLLPAA
jgi:hypothetical protein